MDTDGAESPGGFPDSIGKDQLRLGEHHVADNTTIQLHHEVQLVDEVRVAPELMQYIMLRAAGAVYIPESLAGKFFHSAVIRRRFKSDFL